MDIFCPKQGIEGSSRKVVKKFELWTGGCQQCKTGSERGEWPSAWISRTYGQNNPKDINPEEIHSFEYVATERRTWWSAKLFLVEWYNINYWRN